jgi:hypothetical protein
MALQISALKTEYLNYILKDVHLTSEQKELAIQRVLLPDFTDVEITAKLNYIKGVENARNNNNKCLTCNGELDYTWHGPECNNNSCYK